MQSASSKPINEGKISLECMRELKRILCFAAATSTVKCMEASERLMGYVQRRAEHFAVPGKYTCTSERILLK